jgi:hypothetical protein
LGKRYTKTEAFAEFRATLTNVRRSRSAVSNDGQTVVLALWNDRFFFNERPVRYQEKRDNLTDE